MRLDNRITGKTKLLGLIGNPVEQTKSPLLHNTLSSMLGIDATYIPIKVGKENLEHAVRGLKACNFLGFNVTIPYKEEILNYVDEFTDEVKVLGCANTVKNTGDSLRAYNTDADGFARSFEEQSGTGFKDKTVVLLGAGGAAKSIAVKIASKGASKLYIINRTIDKANEIAATINFNISKVVEVISSNDTEKRDIIEKCDIIVNTTSLGMYPKIEESPLDSNVNLNHKQIVYDVVYNPSKTKLLKQAENFGCKAINGLGMLFYQGILAYEIWLDIKIPDIIIKKLFEEFTYYLND